MKNLNQLGVTELEVSENTNITGGCSFAYDVGFAIRVIWHSASGFGAAGAVAEDIADYNTHCNGASDINSTAGE